MNFFSPRFLSAQIVTPQDQVSSFATEVDLGGGEGEGLKMEEND